MFSSDEEMRAELLRLQKEDPSAIEKLEQQLDEYRVSLSRQDPNYFVQYVLRDEETQEPIRQAPYHVKLQEACTASKAASILGHTELGKALPITTEIPTPTGWKLLADIHPGDLVFAMDGTPTRVISETEVTERDAYMLVFSDGTTQVACGDHQWLAWWTADGYHDRIRSLPKRESTTKEMLLCSSGTWWIPLTLPVDFAAGVAPTVDERVAEVGRWLTPFVDGKSRVAIDSKAHAHTLAETARSLGLHVTVIDDGLEVTTAFVKAVKAIIPQPPALMKCIGVEHPTHTYLAGRAFTVTHNCVTSQTIFISRCGAPRTVLELKKDLDEGKKVEVLTLNQKTRSHEWVEVESIEYDGHVPCTAILTTDGGVGVYSNNHPVYVGTSQGAMFPPSQQGWSMASNVLRTHHVIAALGRFPDLEEYSDFASEDAFALGVIFNSFAKTTAVPKAYADAEVVLRYPLPVKSVPYEYDIVRTVRQFCEKMGWRCLYFPPTENEFTLSRVQHLVIEGITPWLNERGYSVHRDVVSNIEHQVIRSTNSVYFHDELFQLRPEVAKAFVAGLLLSRVTDKAKIGNNVMLKGFSFTTSIGFYWLLKVARVRAEIHNNPKRKSFFVKLSLLTITDILNVLENYTLANPVVKSAIRSYRWTLGLIGNDEVGLEGTERLRQSNLLKAMLVRDSKEPDPWRWSKTSVVVSAGVQATYAVTIKSEEHTHLTDGMLTHNTQQISIGRSLWEIGKNPNIRICIIQATEGLAEDIVSTIKRYIEHSPEYKRIFPHVRRGVEWTTTSLSVERSPTIKDPTVLAAGVHGNILGRRFDLIIGDDFLTSENTATEYMRDDVFNWMLTTPMSRITRNGRIWLIGNAWSREDALHRFARMSGWNQYVFPVRDPVTKKSYWPERWPEDRISDFEMRRTPWEVARALDCKARSDEAGRFREAWFTAALERGHGMFGDDTMCWALAQMPPGCQTFTGVDLGISESAGADVTAISTLMIKPDGRISLINVEAGNWDANEIIDRIIRAHMRFKSLVFVESLFAQRWILQLIRKKAPFVPVFPFQTRGTGTVRNKRHTFYGVESLAAELAQGLWDIPRAKTGQVDPEIQSFIQGCLVYAPDEHTDDRVMSVWIALQGARKQTGIIGTGLTAESGMEIMLETQPLTYEERMEQARNERTLAKEKSAASWWEDVRNELDLPDFDQGN